MFKTESTTPHIKPATLWQHLVEAEERVWGHGIVDLENSQSTDSQVLDVGDHILKHGTIVRKIQDYFSNLEARKCCLKLRLEAKKTTFSNIRLVRHDGRDSGIEEGAMMRTPFEQRRNVPQLDPNEFRMFKRSYLCAAFPVLGAPEPPSAFSPSPVQNASTQRLSYSGILSISRPTTPYSMPDSGLDDTEEDTTSLIPSETLCELLKRAFRLSDEKFAHYERSICESFGKLTQQKVLAEELVNQLAALENNSNPFYNPHNFVSEFGRKGYDTWQQQERDHLTELIGKFWQFSLPTPSVNFSAELTGVHQDYRKLLAKLIRYESPYRSEREDLGPAPANSLSSASVRLLKEFGLRYGVAEQYKKFVYLQYLAQHFDVTIWYIQHVTTTLRSIAEWFPSNRSHLVITKQELLIIESSLHLLLGLAGNTISKMKRLFAQNRPPEGVACLIELLDISLSLKSYLSLNPTKPLQDCLRKYVQEAFVTAYERHKMLANSELQQSSFTVQICPKLLNILIMNIRDEVTDYKSNYQTTFDKYFNISEMASQAFYSFLISDVLQLCQAMKHNVTTPEIDLLLLSLAYRLNSLDHDWARYIPPESQRWREPFLTLSIHWTLALSSYCPLLVIEAISGDTFQSLSLLGNFQSSTTSSSSQRGRSTSLRSLSASVRSAFSSVSSTHSTPVLGGKETPSGPLLEVHGKFVNTQSPIMETSGESILPVAKGENTSSKIPHQIVKDLSPRRSSTHSVDTALFLRDHKHNINNLEESDEVMSFTRQNMRHSNSLPNFKEKALKFFNGASNVNNFEKNEQDGIVQRKRGDNSTSTCTYSDGESDEEEMVRAYPPLCLVNGSRTSEFENFRTKNIPHIDAMIGQQLEHPHPSPITPLLNVLSSGMIRVPSAPSMSTMNPSSFAYPSILKPQTTLLGRPPKDNEQDFLDSFKSDFSVFSLTNQSLSDAPTSTAPLPSSNVDLLVILQRVVGVGRTFCNTICPLINESSSHPHGYWDNVSFTSEELDDLSYCRDNAGGRCQLFLLFSKIVCENLCLYGDNLLSMDVCGLPLSLAKKLVGPKLVEHILAQRQGGLIWGCRHDVAGSTTDCFHYIYRKTFLLCDRFEPVSQEMCTRINSVAALFDHLKKYYEILCSIFGIVENEDVTNFLSDDTEETGYESGFLDDFVVIDNHYGDLDHDFIPHMEAMSSPSTPRTTPFPGLKVPIFPVLQCWRHITSVLRAMCRVLAYRLNLFVRDALSLLLSPDMPVSSLTNRLQPVQDFLSTYLSALSDWLYGDCFRQTLQYIWLYIVEDFEEEVSKLRTGEYNTEKQAELITHALSYLLRFMNNMGKGVNLDQLLSYSEDVSFKLQLYTLITPVLTALYEKLVAYYSASSDGNLNQGDIPSGILRRMKLELQSRRKCFTGRQLVSWLLRHQEKGILTGGSELTEKLDPETGRPMVSREKAHAIAQRILEQGLILDIELEASLRTGRTSSEVSDEMPYPSISIHNDLEGNLSGIRRAFINRHGIYDENSSKSRSSSNSSATTIRDTDLISRSNSGAFSRSSHNTPENDGKAVAKATDSPVNLTDQNSIREYFSNHLAQAPNESSAPSSGKFLKGDNSDSKNEERGNDYPSSNEQIEEIVSKRTDGKLLSNQNETVSGVNQSNGDTANNVQSDINIDTHSNKNPKSMTLAQTLAAIQNADTTSPLGHNKTNANTPKVVTNRTPQSSISQDTSTWSTSQFSALSFQDSPQRFYTFSPRDEEKSGDRGSQEFNPRRIPKANQELFNMVETCFYKKITPDYLLLILYARRKYDQTAKKFFKNIPGHVLNRLCQEVDAPSMTCTGS